MTNHLGRACLVLTLVSAVDIAGCGSSGSGNAAGGSSTGGAGAGGAGGSAGTGGTAGTAVYGTTCAKIESLPCWSDDCDTYAQSTLDQAADKGCTTQALDVFKCYSDHPPVCDPNAGFSPDPACKAAVDTYFACLAPPADCYYGGFLGPCVVLCSKTFWATDCSVKPGSSTWNCLCRDGPKTGLQFTMPSVSHCDYALSAQTCAP